MVIQGYPAVGIVDSGVDITIMNGDLFKKVAAAAHLKQKDFKKADKWHTIKTVSCSCWMDEWT